MGQLRIDGLSKIYKTPSGPLTALKNIALTVDPGELLVILGPSGCGKSTLLQIIAGLESASSGSVSLNGKPVHGPGVDRALIWQRPSLFPWLSATDNVAFGLRMRGMSQRERRARAMVALEHMGLEHYAELWPHQLSGGMQQRIALARALVLDPTVILMDEPFAAVDALRRSSLQRDICALDEGRMIVFVTHSIREALVIADRILILSDQPGHILTSICPEGRRPRAHTPTMARMEASIEKLLQDHATPRI